MHFRLSFKSSDKLTASTVEHHLDCLYKDYIYDFRSKISNIGKTPVVECEIELNTNEEVIITAIRESVEELLGDIEHYYTKQN